MMASNRYDRTENKNLAIQALVTTDLIYLVATE